MPQVHLKCCVVKDADLTWAVLTKAFLFQADLNDVVYRKRAR